MIDRILRLGTLAASAAILAAGCGKKGPPLPPFVRIPAAVETIAAARAGHQVYVTLTIPAANVDASLPVDIARVEVYGYTGTMPPPTARWPELGTLVATIPVEPPPVASEDEPEVSSSPGADSGAARPGTSVTVAETLGADELVARVLPEGPASVPAGVSGRPAGAPRRFYVAIPFSQRGRPGPPGAQAEFLLATPPDPPADLRATYDARSVSLVWEPSGGLIGFLLDRQAGIEDPPFDEPAQPGDSAPVSAAPAPTTYRVYRTTPAGATSAGTPAGDTWRATLPVPMSGEPLVQMAASDAVSFGEERCYAVRAERGGVLSDASSPVCLTPIDRFAPAVPSGLAAVPSEGAINLIWEPNADADLAGYLVLRRGPGDATLRQLMDRPIAEARYRDASIEPGTHYTYAVVAVDRQSPMPNVSAPSATVDEVAP